MSNYEEIFSRNIGFFSVEEQASLCKAKVFIVGVGGMGGACVQSLVRAGIGNIGIADHDHFELSNINRQVFANIHSVNKSKTIETKERLLEINPNLSIECYDDNWVTHLDEILRKYDLVINCMDDMKMTIFLYRKCREKNISVIDSYNMSPLSSVYVIKSTDPLPEVRFKFPTINKEISEITEQDVNACKLKELEYILTISSAIKYVKLEVAEQVILGLRPRFSLGPMVIVSGNLMAYEAIFLILKTNQGTDFKGYFFNPYHCRVEKEGCSMRYVLKKWMVKRFLNKYMLPR